jgi:hypothetical protein
MFLQIFHAKALLKDGLKLTKKGKLAGAGLFTRS